MILNYVTVGTHDMPATVAFYDALLAEAGLTRVVASERMTYWLGEGFAFAAAIPFDGQSATSGNGTVIGFGVATKAEVERLHQLALDLGGTSEGAPGPRGPRFTAYVRDLDGNKLCFSELA